MNLQDLDIQFKRYVIIYKIRIKKNKLIINKPIPVAVLVFIKNYLKFTKERFDDIIVEPENFYRYWY